MRSDEKDTTEKTSDSRKLERIEKEKKRKKKTRRKGRRVPLLSLLSGKKYLHRRENIYQVKRRRKGEKCFGTESKKIVWNRFSFSISLSLKMQKVTDPKKDAFMIHILFSIVSLLFPTQKTCNHERRSRI